MGNSRKPGRSFVRAPGALPLLVAAALALPLLVGACAQRSPVEASQPAATDPVHMPRWPARGPVMLAARG